MGRIFISYAHIEPDRSVATHLYHDLVSSGFEPWLDEYDLLVGENWAERIAQVIRQCKQFIAVMSTHSINKQGFVQKELKTALDVLDTMPIDNRFLLPLRVDECYPKHSKLGELHWTNLFPDYTSGFQKLLRSDGVLEEDNRSGWLFQEKNWMQL